MPYNDADIDGSPDYIDHLISRGDAYRDEFGHLVGIASDGTHVSLQFASYPVTLAYLAEHPTPDTW